MTNYWLAVSMLARREVLRFWRDRSRVIGFAGAPMIFWLVVGSGYSDLARFLPGSLVLTAMFSAIFTSMSLIDDRRDGFLRCVLVSPAPRLAIVLGKVIGGTALAAIQSLAFLAIATLGGTLYPDANYSVLAALMVLIALAFTAVGFVIAWLVPSAQGFHAVINLLFLPLWMVSGSVFRMEDSSTWLRWLMLANPVTYANESITYFLGLRADGAQMVSPTASVVVVAVAALLPLIAAAYVIQRPSERNLS
jgi:ABC-2 type transport system permease protein